MEFVQIAATITDYLKSHLLISIAALVAVIAYSFSKRPEKTFKFLVFIGIMAIIVYGILQLGSSTDSGVSAKEELTQKTRKAINE
jgi:hypothetical protein